MTRWKKDATEFGMSVIDDNKGSRYVRIPKPIDEHLGEPEMLVFVKSGKNIVIKARNLK